MDQLFRHVQRRKQEEVSDMNLGFFSEKKRLTQGNVQTKKCSLVFVDSVDLKNFEKGHKKTVNWKKRIMK